jgi:hypothetical protein
MTITKKLTVTGAALSHQVRAAMVNPVFETRPGQCLRFVRECVTAVGTAKAWPVPIGYNAAQALDWFKEHGYVQVKPGDLQPGDLLFKAAHPNEPAGHVGVYVGSSNVGENSSTHIGRVQGAKGFRTLAQFGKYDAIVRCA